MRSTSEPARYCYLAYRFHLPYRVFLDDGVYFVASEGVRWRLSLKTVPKTSIDFTTPPIDFGKRAQLRLDNHGFSGLSEVVAGFPLAPELTEEEIWARQTGKERITLSMALGPVNRLIGLYRAKTWEHWFRALGSNDVPAYSMFLVPANGSEYQWFGTSTNVEIASGYPYLKTERWYDDLLRRCELGELVPFFLELTAEGRDALARNNLRLAASNFALAVEALFRALLQRYFPSTDLRRPPIQLLGTYFGRYREVADPADLPVSKKRAFELLREIWEPRDDLMHGHELALDFMRVKNAETALLELLRLWFARPGADQFLIEGPFVAFGSTDFPSRTASELIARARNRLAGGHPQDAEEAARFALTLEPSSAHAYAILGVVAAQQGQFEEAAELMQRAMTLEPGLPGVASDLAAVRARLST